jgi:hypothetical protein
MSLLYCWSCGASYRKGEVMFCPACGKPLPERTDLLDEINALKNEPLSFRLLRFLRGFLVILGFLLMIAAILLIPLVFTGVSQALVASQLTIEAARTLSFWFTLLFCALTFFSGIAWVILAYIIGILLGTYDRSREASRLMRRLALMLSDNKDSD